MKYYLEIYTKELNRITTKSFGETFARRFMQELIFIPEFNIRYINLFQEDGGCVGLYKLAKEENRKPPTDQFEIQ